LEFALFIIGQTYLKRKYFLAFFAEKFVYGHDLLLFTGAWKYIDE
jgi:hypothetical protein